MSSQSFDIQKDDITGRSGIYRQVEGLIVTPNGREVWRTRITGYIPAEAFSSSYNNGDVLTTNGSGVLSFAASGGGPSSTTNLGTMFLLMGG